MVRVMVQTAHKYWSRISISRAISSDPFSSWDETSFGCHLNKLCGILKTSAQDRTFKSNTMGYVGPLV